MMAMAAAPQTLQAQVTMYGALSNFDVINTMGEPAYGFEIEIQGVSSIGGSFTYNRYGTPQVVPFSGGVYVRYMAPWNPATQQFMTSTVSTTNPTATNGHSCLLNTLNYDINGCEHFGVWTTANPSATVYRWMIADPLNPGQLKTAASPVAIPAPVWLINPPAVAGGAVEIVADVAPPIPPPPAKTYGEAQWMKTYKNENVRMVALEELVRDNPVDPQEPAELETAWDLVQSKLNDVSNGKHKQKRGALGGGSKAVLRRFEFYKYTGAVDPVTGQALCLDGICAAPADSEVGDFIGAQNGAINLNVPAQYQVSVAVAGDGAVSSSDSVIKCPGTNCSEFLTPDTSVTLTAKNGKGIFSGWGGPCAGLSLTCSFKVDSDAPVTATFLTPFKLTTKTVGSGSVASNPSGSSFLQGTTVTLTETPAAGNVFMGWSGACTGTAQTCTVTINADTTVTATFSGAVAPPPPTTYKLVMKINGSGSVSSNPTGSSFVSGTAVTVTAVPASGAIWKGWTGSTCSGLSLSCPVTMTADTTVTANFR